MIAAEKSDGRSCVRRAMKKLAELGLTDTSGTASTRTGARQGRRLWPTATVAVPPESRHRCEGGEGRVRLARRGGDGRDPGLRRPTPSDEWHVEVNHAIKETGLSFTTDAVLALPTKTSEVRLFGIDNGTTTQARPAKEVWDYERNAGHRVWEGARGPDGGTYPFWQRHRYTRSERFPRLHVLRRARRSPRSTNAARHSPPMCAASPSRS